MATTAQILANQQNALLSTGPRTEQGKAIASQNARRHGCYAADLRFSSPDEEAAFDRLHAANRKTYLPYDEAEERMVYDLTRAAWLEDFRAQEESATVNYLRNKLLKTPDTEDPAKPIEVRLAEERVTNKTLRGLTRRAAQIRAMASSALKELLRLQKVRHNSVAEILEDMPIIENLTQDEAVLLLRGRFDPFSVDKLSPETRKSLLALVQQ